MKNRFLQYSAKTVLPLLLCTVLTTACPGIPMTAAAAGGLNADEQALLNDFAAGITVDGQSLKPPASYVALAAELLSEVDLSTSEVDRLYAKMDAAYDALRSEHITSVEEAQNSLAKNIVYAITSEAMQILENSPNKTDKSGDDDDDSSDDVNSNSSANGAGSNSSGNSSAGNSSTANGSSTADGGSSSNGAGVSGSAAGGSSSSDSTVGTGNTAGGSSSDGAGITGSAADDGAAAASSQAGGEASIESKAESNSEAAGEPASADDLSAETETTAQNSGTASDSASAEETGASQSDFPLPIAIGAAAAFLAATAGILFFRHRGDR